MKTVLITGASRGIGKATAQEFLKDGWNVIGTSLDGTLDLTDAKLTALKLDLTKSDQIQAVANYLKDNKITLDLLVNNAGILIDENDIVVDLQKLRKTLDVNLFGTIALTERLLPSIDPNGQIINISSAAGSLEETDNMNETHSPYHYPAYKISKCALNMYSRTLSNRMNRDGSHIIVSSVHPGWVKTDMGGINATLTPEEVASDIFKLYQSKVPSGHFWFKGNKYPW